MFRVCKFFIQKPKGSNSMAQRLSVTNLWTDMRFLMIAGHTNTLRRVKAREGEAIIPCPVFFTAAKEPLPTVTGGMVLVLKRDCRLPVLR